MRRPLVLLVEDRASIRQTLRKLLARYGCDITEVANGESALARMAETLFDVVFLDLKLPHISGLEVLQRMHGSEWPVGRVIVLTGFLEPSLREETARLGAFCHLTKDPISLSDVRAAFEAALAAGHPPPPSVLNEVPAPPAVPGVAPEMETEATRVDPPAAGEPKTPAPGRPVRGRRRDTRPRVLVLDDQKRWLKTIERLLGGEFAVTATGNPDDALRAVKRERFDAVILDVRLSKGASGLDVLVRMAANTLDLRAIILTGDDKERHRWAWISAKLGASEFVMKDELATVPAVLRGILKEPRFVPRVFLSYVRRDHDTVRKLYLRLEQQGMQPWMDTEDLLAAEEWDPRITRRIHEADHFVFCHSAHSWDTQGWTRKEVDTAIERLPFLPEGRHFLIVARLDETEVVGSLSRFQHVDLFRRGGFARLLRAVHADARSSRRKA
jgi:CheY-like chemotaxis protein